MEMGWAPTFSCCLPCNLCSFPNSHLHCQKWASSHLLLTGLLPFLQGRALPSLCPVPAGCTAWILSFAFILTTVPNQVNTAVCVSPETSPPVWGAGRGGKGMRSFQLLQLWAKVQTSNDIFSWMLTLAVYEAKNVSLHATRTL